MEGPTGDIESSAVFKNLGNGIGCRVEGVDREELEEMINTTTGGTPSVPAGTCLLNIIGGMQLEDADTDLTSGALKITFPGNFTGTVMITYRNSTNQAQRNADDPPSSLQVQDLVPTYGFMATDQGSQVKPLANLKNCIRQEGLDPDEPSDRPSFVLDVAEIGNTSFMCGFQLVDAEDTTPLTPWGIGVAMQGMVEVFPSVGGVENTVYLSMADQIENVKSVPMVTGSIIKQAQVWVTLVNSTTDKGLGVSYRNSKDQYCEVTAAATVGPVVKVDT